MRSTYTPKYKMLDLRTSTIISKQDIKNRNKQEKSFVYRFYEKATYLIDIYSSIHLDNLAYEKFDYVILGDDHLTNAVVAFELSKKGKRVLICNSDSYESKPSVISGLDRDRFGLESKMMCAAISKILDTNIRTTQEKIIKECFGSSYFPHAKENTLPMYNNRNNFGVDIIEDKIFLFDFGKKEANDNKSLLEEATSEKLVKLNLEKGKRKNKIPFVKYTYYDTLIETDNLILTNNYESFTSIEVKEHKNTIKVGAALNLTTDFQVYDISDKLKELNETIKIIRKLI